MAEESNNYKVMILDDDDFLVDMYSTRFGKSGVLVDTSKDGKTLLEKLRKGETAHLLLLDIVLPELDGISTLEIIRKENLASGVPVVMLTNQNDESDINKTKDLGVAGYIVKASSTPSEVVEKVLEIIKSSKK